MTLLSLNDLYKDSFRIWQCKGLRKWVSLLEENSSMYSSWINSEKKKTTKTILVMTHSRVPRVYLLMSQSVSLLCKTHLLHRVLMCHIPSTVLSPLPHVIQWPTLSHLWSRYWHTPSSSALHTADCQWAFIKWVHQCSLACLTRKCFKYRF